MPGTGDAPEDLLRERAEQSRWKLWLLLEAGRLSVTALLLVIIFAALVGAGHLLPGGTDAIAAGDAIDTLFSSLLTAILTVVTLTVTLNQLVLSQELGAAGDQRDRMEEAMRFRDDVADAVDAPVGPPRPSQFLRALVEVAGEHAAALRDAVDEEQGEVAGAVDDLADSLTGNADRVAAGLDGARFGDFDVVSSALDFNYSWKIVTARRIRERYGDVLGDDATEALDGLTETLRLFGPAREHVKTLYFQWDLVDLSRRILVAAVPASLVAIGMVIYVEPVTYGGTVAGVSTLVLVVAAATTVALLPFALLLAYVMRIATVAKHTLSIGPFILRETDDVAEVEWGD